MEVGSQEWIEHSLARLEELETERDGHETALESATDADSLRKHSEAIESLDEQIKSLYAQLEAVAEEEGEEEDPSDAAATNEFRRDEQAVQEPAPAAVSAAGAAPASTDDELPDNPFGAPAAAPAATADFGAPASDFGAPAADFGSYDAGDDFDAPKGGAAKWIVLGLVIAGGGVGGYLYMNNQKKPEPAPAAPTEVKVIEAKAVPEDTQGPRGAKGADVEVTPGMERDKKKRGGGGRGGGGGGGGGSKKSSDSGRDKKIKLSDSDDPLG